MSYRVIVGDCIAGMRHLDDRSVHCCVTSPPYFGLRDYGHDRQIGLEQKPDLYVAKLVEVFREVHRVLRDDGTLWLNLGDSYANDEKWGGSSGGKHAKALHGNTGIGRTKTMTGLKPKNLIGIPRLVAFALQDDGWYLRQDIIWHKPNPMPESVRDRCTKAHEYLFLLAKSERYYFNSEAIKEPAIHKGRVVRATGGRSKVETDKGSVERRTMMGFTDHDVVVENRNRRSVWTVATKPYMGAHFATFPPDLIRPCILAGCPKGGTVLDTFGGSGTTAEVAVQEGREAVLFELNPSYVELIHQRMHGLQLRIS